MFDLGRAFRYAFNQRNINQMLSLALLGFGFLIIAIIVSVIFELISTMMGVVLAAIGAGILGFIFRSLGESINNFLFKIYTEFYAFRVRASVQEGNEEIVQAYENTGNDLQRGFFFSFIEFVYGLPLTIITLVVVVAIFLLTGFDSLLQQEYLNSTQTDLFTNNSTDFSPEVFTAAIVLIVFGIVISLIGWVIKCFIILPAFYEYQKTSDWRSAFNFSQVLNISGKASASIVKYMISTFVSGLVPIVIYIALGMLFLIIILLTAGIGALLIFCAVCILAPVLLVLGIYIFLALYMFYYPHLQGQLFKEFAELGV